MKKDMGIYLVLGIIVILIIIGIKFIPDLFQPEITEQDMQCIADNSILIVSKTCGYCAKQKEMLGEHLNKFNLLYTDEDPTLFDTYNLRGVPTWVINERSISGVQSLKTLKELTGC